MCRCSSDLCCLWRLHWKLWWARGRMLCCSKGLQHIHKALWLGFLLHFWLLLALCRPLLTLQFCSNKPVQEGMLLDQGCKHTS